MREGAIAAVPGVSVPVIWSFLGYSFPAGSMIVGLLACLMVRLFITLDTPGPKRWALDAIVTGIAMLVTAVWIAEQQVNLFAALGTGGGHSARLGPASSPFSSGADRAPSTRSTRHSPASPRSPLR